MDQHLSFITVATADLDAARRFYVTGLGWRPTLDIAGEIIFFQVAAGTVLGFFDAAKFSQDLADGEDRSTVGGITLAHNVDSPAAVGALVEAMVQAGGQVLKTPQPGAFGGIFHAHVTDPNGVIWEIAHNPSLSIAADGTVTFG